MGICQPNESNESYQLNSYPITQSRKREMKHPYMVKACPDDVTLQVGKEYVYCTCGLSKGQPFCDGSHIGTPFTPLKFTAQQKRCFLCLCKKTKNPPYCDNSHKKKRDLDF